MASRKFNGVIRTPHTEPVELWVEVDVGAGSAVTAGTQTCTSYVTVSKPAGTGIYRLTFKDSYPRCIWADGAILKAAGTLDADIYPVARTNQNTATPLVVDFQVRKGSDGTALDPVSVTLMFHVVMRNSQVTI